MSAASISHSGSAAPGLSVEDYSLYSNLSDDELLQLAIERSLTDTHCSNANTASNSRTTSSTTSTTSSAISRHQPESSTDPAARNTNQPRPKHPHNPTPTQTTAHYSSPNPPAEKPPDPYVNSRSFLFPASCCEYLNTLPVHVCHSAQRIHGVQHRKAW